MRKKEQTALHPGLVPTCPLTVMGLHVPLYRSWLAQRHLSLTLLWSGVPSGLGGASLGEVNIRREH